jgi:hypothetical protein
MTKSVIGLNWQKEFANNVKKSSNKSLNIYHGMVKQNMEQNLFNVYPILYNLIDKNNWNNLVDRFVERHACHTNLFWKMPKELLTYVESNELELQKQFPYILDLIKYEWSIVEIYYREDRPVHKTSFDGTLNSIPSFSGELEIFNFSYPVYKKEWKNINQKGNYFLLVFRNQVTFKVELRELSSYLFVILKNLMEGEFESINELLDEIKLNTAFVFDKNQKVQLLQFFMELMDLYLIS